MSADPSEPIWNRPEPGARGASLSRDKIAEAALNIADTEGFEAVSMRRLASDLDVGTMTLYHYVRSKRELLGLMEDGIMGELLVPDDELPDDWREALTELAVRTYEVFRRHSWALQALRGNEENGPNGMRHFEQSLAVTSRLGLDGREQLELITLVDDYTLGVVQRQADADAFADAAETFIEQIPDGVLEYFDALVESGEFPNIAGLAGSDDPLDTIRLLGSVFFDENRFRRGLERLLDGIEADLSRRSRSRRGARSPRASQGRSQRQGSGRRAARTPRG
ncbi:MAG TPA: TetR/AcrR family transcriptional regulator [Thermoleophilaceae bacterium]|jgi:AcrR family transcriptional regulator